MWGGGIGPKNMDSKKLIFWLMSWGWRGSAALAIVVLGVWLYSLWIY